MRAGPLLNSKLLLHGSGGPPRGAPQGLLAGVTVLDLSEHVSGQFASRIFADHGALTWLVEPVQGSRVRRLSPLRADDGESFLFWHLNGGKSSVSLDIDHPEGFEALVALARSADVVILSNAGLKERLGVVCPHALIGLVTDFGPKGPYARWSGCELIFQALSGSMYVSGLPGREPLYGVGLRTYYSAGLWLYVSLMAALCGGRRLGLQYGPVEVSVHEAACAMEENFSMRWAYSGQLMLRGGDPSRAVCTLRAADGYAILFLRSLSGQWKALCDVIKAPELLNDPRFATWSLIQKNWNEVAVEANTRLHHLSLTDLIAAGEKANLVIAKVETAITLRDEAHLAQRQFWQDAVTADGLEGRQLGPLFTIPAKPAQRNRPAPGRSGELPELNTQTRQRLPTAAAQSPRPLEGLSVLDFTTAWAGPMSTKILAILGAKVVKIEGPEWLDSWRGPPKPTKLEQYPDGVAGEHPFDRCARFNAQNHEKLDVAMDLKSLRAQAIIRDMLPKFDLLVANFRPGALDRLGLGYEAASRINPALSIIEMPAVGKGPLMHRIGLGPTMEAMAGIADRIGYADGEPLGSGSSYLDPMGALHGASASLTALYGRLVHGEGSYVEIAQREAAMHWIGELLLADIDKGTATPLAGNNHPQAAPHNAFPAAGDDCWIAIACFEDEQWIGLCKVLDRCEWLKDERFVTTDSRVAHRAILEGNIGEVTRHNQAEALAHRLQDAGVPAAPVCNGRDLFNDPQLRSSDWFVRLDHPAAGSHDYAGLPLVFGGKRLHARRASPCFGEHTHEVLGTLGGLSKTDLGVLAADGTIVERPQVSKG